MTLKATERTAAKGSLFTRLFSFAHDILDPLVGPQSEVDALTQFHPCSSTPRT
jgi:hypothetical protein